MTTSCFGSVFIPQVLRCALHEPGNAMQAWQTILIVLTGNAAVLAARAYLAKLFIGHKLSRDVSSFQAELKATSAAAIERLKSDLQHWKDGNCKTIRGKTRTRRGTKAEKPYETRFRQFAMRLKMNSARF